MTGRLVVLVVKLFMVVHYDLHPLGGGCRAREPWGVVIVKLRDAIIQANKRDNKGGRHYWDYQGDWGTGRKQPTGTRKIKFGRYMALR